MILFLWQFAFFFTFILVAGYLVPAGQFYLRFYVFKNERTESSRVQQRQPSARDIAREVRYSLLTVFVFAVLGTLLWRCYVSGHTSIYWDLRRYPWYYLPLSFMLLLIFHDTYFY